MFANLKVWAYLAVALVVGVLGYFAYGVAYTNGKATCVAERAEEREIAANALAEATRQSVEADAAATAERAKARSLAAENRRLRDAKLDAVPDSGCQLDVLESLIMHATYCERFPAAPVCLSPALP